MLSRAPSLSLAFFLLTVPGYAEEPVLLPASHVAPMTPLSQSLKFSHQQPTVGERVVQRVGMELNLHTVIKQAGQVAHDGTTALRRRQEREIEVLEVIEGRARKAKVSYPLARLMSPENSDPAAESAQEVEGNSYLITRSNDRLLVTDLDGAIPTREEFEIVVSSMESFGQANPLAEFLLAREIHVGETLQVPTSIANKMMGFDSLGDVRKFELQLVEVKEISHKQCAVFNANIVALGKPDNPLHVQAEGPIVIELATCRTIEATLTGPISLRSSDEGVEYSASGDLLLAIRSHYSAKK